MRILHLVHRWLPAHRAGVENYVAALATAQAAAGCEVAVCTALKDVARPDGELEETGVEGIRTFQIVNNLVHDDFRETWDHPGIGARMAETVARFEPDALHVHQLMNLSAAHLPGLGVPAVMSLHDFWLSCPRFGHRFHPRGEICVEISGERCGGCMARTAWSQPGMERAAAPIVSGLARAGLDVSGPLSRAARRLRSGESAFEQPPEEEWRRVAEALAERDAALRTEVVPAIHSFLAASRFVGDKLVEWGLPRDRVRVHRTGVETARFAEPTHRAPEGLRAGFLGTLAAHKGAGLLLEAWGKADLGECDATLEIRGDASHHPGLAADLGRAARDCGATLEAALGRDEVPGWLAGLDLLVVPSLWWENAPFVVLEAQAAGTPVLVAGTGGMPELVEEGRDGWVFKVGDAADLATHLERLAADPALLAACRAHETPVVDIAEDAAACLGLYAEAVQ